MKSTSYASFLRQKREELGLSQAFVGERAQMSRASYVAVEKGTKELTLAEAGFITQLFGITIDELLRTQAPDQTKYRDMILAFLRAAKNSKTAIKKTKLTKLLYLADFSWYYLHKKSLSGQGYRKTMFGPAADVFFSLLDEMEQGGIINIKQIYRDDYHMYEIEETKGSTKRNLTSLTKKETDHLEKIWHGWAGASTAEIVTYTNNQIPNQEAVLGEIIPYEYILKEDAHTIY